MPKQAVDKDYQYLNAYSFNIDIAINHLLKINIPLLIAYGSKDVASINNDLLPLIFLSNNKNNLTLKCYPGYDHNFIINNEFNFPLIFNDISNWLLNY